MASFRQTLLRGGNCPHSCVVVTSLPTISRKTCRDFIDDEPIRARRVSSAERFVRWSQTQSFALGGWCSRHGDADRRRRYFYVGRRTEEISVWDVVGQRPFCEPLSFEQGMLCAYSVSPNRRFLATMRKVSQNRRMFEVWDLVSGITVKERGRLAMGWGNRGWIRSTYSENKHVGGSSATQLALMRPLSSIPYF